MNRSTTSPTGRRTRRGLGALVVSTALLSPLALALAPAASADQVTTVPGLLNQMVVTGPGFQGCAKPDGLGSLVSTVLDLVANAIQGQNCSTAPGMDPLPTVTYDTQPVTPAVATHKAKKAKKAHKAKKKAKKSKKHAKSHS